LLNVVDVVTIGRVGRLRHPLVVFFLTGATATVLTLALLQARLSHTFPSMIDDWSAISQSQHQIRDVLTLRNPEEFRYRPGFVVWNYLQWHTFGGVEHPFVPIAWGVLRVMALIFGLVAAAFVLARRDRPRGDGDLLAALLAGGAAVAVATIPGSATDLARFGPQEPLMVGLMCGGGALIAIAVRRCVSGTASVAQTWVVGVSGLALWTAGIAQKETSVCALVLVPFLWMATRDWRASLIPLATARRRTVRVLLVLAVAAFTPMLLRVVELSVADKRVYDSEPDPNVIGSTLEQLSHMNSALGSSTGTYLLLGAVVLIAASASSRKIEWLSMGLVLTGLASLAFAAQTPESPSRYFLPLVALSALAVVRLAAAMARVTTMLVVVGLGLVAVLQAPAAHREVGGWLAGERAQEQIVRAVAERRAAGCRVTVAGTDIELILALPVLERISHQRPGGCAPGDRFLVVVTGSMGEASADDDPALAACGVDRVVVAQEGRVGRIYRCEPAAS
jgi:hypothetical protein